MLTPYKLVRIVRLLRPREDYDGWRVNRRAPRRGDVGTIIDIFRGIGLPTNYVVDSSDEQGITIWLGDFDAEELEPVK